MAPAQSPGWRRLFRGQFRKTKMCHFHALGRCHYGDRCAFAHNPEDLECAPDLTKTALCIAWQKGHCPLKAADCHFAHGTNELRLTPAFNKAKLSQRTKGFHDDDGSTQEGCSISVSRESTGTTSYDVPAPLSESRSACVVTKRPTASSLINQPWCNSLPISAPPGLELPATPYPFRAESAAFAATAAAAAAVAATGTAVKAADAAAVAAMSASLGPSMACVYPRQPPEWHPAWSGLATLTPKGTSTTPPMAQLPSHQDPTPSWPLAATGSARGMPCSPANVPRSPLYVSLSQRFLQFDEGRSEIAALQP
mmetsp:Transcript_112916/g.224767  ORF Transcript_112916/g.224767 Transcript_112916/m.224767 type:complete len:310 (-) Transcript_112916:73-1002(-)